MCSAVTQWHQQVVGCGSYLPAANIYSRTTLHNHNTGVLRSLSVVIGDHRECRWVLSELGLPNEAVEKYGFVDLDIV